MLLAVMDTMGCMDVRHLLKKNLELVMADRGVHSQMALAKLSGVSQSMIGSILRAERDTTTGTLVRLADSLNVQPWMLLVDNDAIDAATAPGAAKLINAYAALDEQGRMVVLSVADSQAAAQRQE